MASVLRQYNCVYLGAFTKLRKAIISFVMSVRPSVRMDNSSLTALILMKFDI
jgi:hypothetical protein